jgi:hypothetical protein
MNFLLLAFEPGALNESQVESVRACAPGLRVAVTKERDEIEALLGEIEVAAGQFPRDLLAKAACLRWFQQWGAGADWLLRHPEAAEVEFVSRRSGITNPHWNGGGSSDPSYRSRESGRRR